METNMELVLGLYERIRSLSARAKDVIANSQKQRGEFAALTDSKRLFCAFLANEANGLLSSSATKIGIKLDEEYPNGVEEAARQFFASSAQFLGTHESMTMVGYSNAANVLVDSAEALITRAENVLLGKGSMVSS